VLIDIPQTAPTLCNRFSQSKRLGGGVGIAMEQLSIGTTISGTIEVHFCDEFAVLFSLWPAIKPRKFQRAEH
jgi:hypothetical protein